MQDHAGLSNGVLGYGNLRVEARRFIPPRGEPLVNEKRGKRRQQRQIESAPLLPGPAIRTAHECAIVQQNAKRQRDGNSFDPSARSVAISVIIHEMRGLAEVAPRTNAYI